jgi:hypothetical protein
VWVLLSATEQKRFVWRFAETAARWHNATAFAWLAGQVREDKLERLANSALGGGRYDAILTLLDLGFDFAMMRNAAALGGQRELAGVIKLV